MRAAVVKLVDLNGELTFIDTGETMEIDESKIIGKLAEAPITREESLREAFEHRRIIKRRKHGYL